MIYIGIDPGQSGALAVLDDTGIAYAIPFDETDYVEELSKYRSDRMNARCVVENVHAMPKQGVSSSFNFGRNLGWILGVLAGLGIPVELVNPQKWKREFSCTSDKNTSISVARRMFPNVSLKQTPRCRKDNDGMAEALLMAEYCRRHN